MNIIRQVLKLNKQEYYEKHLLIINHLLPVQMTPKEAKVLAAFMSLEGDIANDPFCTSGRKIVKDKLSISAGGLGNYLTQLEEKKFIIREGKSYTILPILIPEKNHQGYQFRLEQRNES